MPNRTEASEHSRRRFVTTFLSTSVLATVAPLTSLASEDHDRLDPEWHGPRQRLSKVVLDHALEDMAEVHLHLRTGDAPRGPELRRAAAVSRLFFGHLEETGTMKQLENELTTTPERYQAFAPTREELSNIANILRDHNVGVDAAQLQADFAPSPSRERGLTVVRQLGLAEYGNRVTAALESAAGRRPSAAASPDAVAMMASLCDGLDMIAALLAVGCAFGVIPYCFAAALVWLLSAALRWVGFC